MAAPAMVVRVAANIDDLRKNLTEGRTQLEVTTNGMRQLATTAGGDTAMAFRRLEDASTRADQPGKAITQTYRQFDGVLQAMGVNIGPHVKGLEDIANASGKSAGQLGKLGTAGLVAGAAFAGWQIGRWIAEMAGLDKTVESLWRNLLGFADAAGGAAANKTETLAKASAIAGREIHSLSQAMKIIEGEFQRSADAAINWNETMAAAHKELRGLSEETTRDIEIAQKAGATQEQLTNKFGLSALALKLLTERHKDAAKASEEHRQKAEALDKAYEKLNSEIANEAGLERMKRDKAGMDFVAAVAESAGQRRKQLIAEQTAAETAAEATRIEQNQREIDGLLSTATAHQASGEIAKVSTDKTIAGYAGIAQQVTVTGEAMKEWINLMRYSAQVNSILSENSLFTSSSQRERIAALSPSAGASSGGSGFTVNIQPGAIVQHMPLTSDRSTVEPLMDLIKRELASGFSQSGGLTPVRA